MSLSFNYSETKYVTNNLTMDFIVISIALGNKPIKKVYSIYIGHNGRQRVKVRMLNLLQWLQKK